MKVNITAVHFKTDKKLENFIEKKIGKLTGMMGYSLSKTEKQIKEIRDHLDRAQNPVFFFDNDPDGLCCLDARCLAIFVRAG